jgi:hypothetical protein
MAQVHENVKKKRELDYMVDPVLGTPLTKAVLLPVMLDAGILKEGKGGYCTEYDYISLPGDDFELMYMSTLSTYENIARKGLVDTSLDRKIAFISGEGDADEVAALLGTIGDCLRKLKEVKISSTGKNCDFEISAVAIKSKQK